MTQGVGQLGSVVPTTGPPKGPNRAVHTRGIWENDNGKRCDIHWHPKYKLDHEETPQVVDASSEVGSNDGAAPGTPKKIDVDKMHAYSDSIRSMNGDRVVVFAGILYPGGTTIFSESIQAIRAIPGDDREFRRDVTEILNTHMDA